MLLMRSIENVYEAVNQLEADRSSAERKRSKVCQTSYLSLLHLIRSAGRRLWAQVVQEVYLRPKH